MPMRTPEEQREYQNNWLKTRRLKWLAENGPCKACGSTEDLMVKYTDPETKVNHRIWSYTAEKRNAELAKCHVLCKPCHHAAVTEENGFLLYHGANGYRYQKCRCDVCIEAHQETKRLKAISARKRRAKIRNAK